VTDEPNRTAQIALEMPSEPNLPTFEPSVPVHVSFVTTADASADAHALARPRLNAFDRYADTVALVWGLLTIVVGVAWNNVAICGLGVVVLIVAVLATIERRSHALQRWVISRRFGSMLGKSTEVTIDDRGFRLSNSLGTTFVPWTSITSVRSTPRTVAFFRGAILFGYVPASAFASPGAQASVVAFAAAHIAASSGNSP
jgi:hypothetical protein